MNHFRGERGISHTPIIEVYHNYYYYNFSTGSFSTQQSSSILVELRCRAN